MKGKSLESAVFKGCKWIVARAAVIAPLLLPSHAGASDLEDLALEGYAVAQKTQVDGDYEGCNYGKQIGLLNGLVFVCSTYHYHYAYMPRVLILQQLRTSDIKVIIDDDETAGTLYRR
ncbi:hypothetical protein [Rhizobium leguminosarum]|uniref:hypothetical protein n=1 Tax=Rhizobium leguminosarum TaxID=384 RepID=UPI00103244E2|nr:hypothetical protein [Rhizobium leguminosarum]NZD54141.1 hypothetical protein [Rhizobium leguminosarum]TAY98595.1 hypothetical protein ELH79_08970 [Rhizobium leguminosarum]TAZ09360.1 hypothetical protein ELH78_08970 [Rhizobium leguminosarum]